MQSNPALLCYVDLEALVIVCTEADSVLNGAEILDVEGTEDPDLVRTTYVNPATGYPVVDTLPMLPPIDDAVDDDPQWKKDGHCCEACSRGHECDGGSCEIGPSEAQVGSVMAGIAIPKHRPVRNPKRSSRIFSRRT